MQDSSTMTTSWQQAGLLQTLLMHQHEGSPRTHRWEFPAGLHKHRFQLHPLHAAAHLSACALCPSTEHSCHPAAAPGQGQQVAAGAATPAAQQRCCPTLISCRLLLLTNCLHYLIRLHFTKQKTKAPPAPQPPSGVASALSSVLKTAFYCSLILPSLCNAAQLRSL